MKHTIAFIIALKILFFSIQISAQTVVDDRHFGKSFDKQFEFAQELLYLNDYKTAYATLLELYQIDSTNAKLNYQLGFASFYANRDKNLALPYLLKGQKFNANAYYFLGLIYHQNKKFTEAETAFIQYKYENIKDKIFSSTEVEKQIRKIKTALKFYKGKQALDVENLGKNINSAYPDYGPVLFANGNKLYFTSRRKGSFPKYKDPNLEYFEDIYYSEKVNDSWEKPVNIAQPFNTKTHDAVVAISEDENTFYLYRTNEGLVGGDILKSTKSNNIWSEPEIFSTRINTKESSESSLSIHPNGHKIYFSSNREGGYGGKDLYFVQKLPNGEWSLPSNLGGMVNTEDDEDGPFISSDGLFLYFSSTGHENMGGFDLFRCRMQDNGLWSAPENMGYPINSVRDDIFISTVNNIDYFFSSNRAGGYGFTDLYHSILPKEKNEFVLIKGRIIENQSQSSLKASVTLFNNKNNKLEGVYKSDRNTGKFVMIVKPGEQYKLFVEAKGYYNYTQQIDLRKSLGIDDVFKTLRMTKKQAIPADAHIENQDKTQGEDE